MTARRAIPKLRPGDKLTAAHYNRLVDHVNANYVTVAPPLEITRATGSVSVRFPPLSLISAAKTDSSGLTARSGTTVGTGNVVKYSLAGTTLNAGPTVTCLNAFGTAVAANAYIMMGQDAAGRWWVLSEDC